MRSLLIVILFLALATIASCSDDILTDVGAQPSYDLNDSDCYNLGVLLT